MEPLSGLIVFVICAVWFMIGLTVGTGLERVTRDGRRRRALARVTPVWEVHVGSDGRDYGSGVYTPGDHVIVSVRKVRRSGKHFERLQQIDVARVRGEDDPDEIMAAVDRAQAMVATLGLTGAA